jgi:hypothetical protein
MKNPDQRQEYAEFLAAKGHPPPAALSQSLRAHVQAELGLRPTWILAKLAFLHSAAALAVVYVCPQFGVSWGTSPVSFMSFYMRFGSEGCAALCGVTLLGTSLLLAALALRPPEALWLRGRLLPVALGLSSLTLLGIFLAGGEAAHAEQLLWLGAGVLAGLGAFELGRQGRYRMQSAMSA